MALAVKLIQLVTEINIYLLNLSITLYHELTRVGADCGSAQVVSIRHPQDFILAARPFQFPSRGVETLKHCYSNRY